MANNTSAPKKENPFLVSILMLLGGILLVAMGEDYLWVLFGVIEIPMQVLGGIVAAVGVIGLIGAIAGKKKAQEKQDTNENQG